MTKLSLLFLGTNYIPGLSKSSIVAMTIIIYIVLTLIPIGLLAPSIMAEYSLLKMLALTGLAAVSVVGILGILYNLAVVKPKTQVK